MPEITINRRTRLGLSWTNEPVQVRTRSGNSYLTIAEASLQAEFTGTARQIRAECQRIGRGQGTADWRTRLFVHGRPVTGIPGDNPVNLVGEILRRLEDDGAVAVTVA